MGLMKKSLGFICGLALGFMVTACAAIFPYKDYGLSLTDSKLLGPTPADDLPLTICEAVPGNKSPCVVFMSDAALELKKDYKDTKDALIACQNQLLKAQ